MSNKPDFWRLSVKDLKFSRVAHWGHRVSHAKNRTNRAFKRNLHRVTVVLGGKRHRLEVPTGVLRKLKKLGLTTHKQLSSKS